jgi:DNA repair exonuclease SbcCD ATPase subunit
MATEDLQINIGANTQDLQNGLNQASQSVQNFGAQLNRATKPTADATNALSNLSRVAQDAPYGFMGIANNLNPLLESFQRLQKETGSAGAALQSMASGLMGPAGIGLALGAVSSLLVVFGDKLFKSSEHQKELAAKAKEHTDTLKEQKDAIEQIYSSVAKESSQVTTLVAVLENENESRKRKLDALAQLKKINPDIFEGLKLEENKVVGLTTAYNKYINSLDSVILLKIKQKELEDVTEKILKAQGTALTQEAKDIIATGQAIKAQTDLKKTDIELRNNAVKSIAEQSKKETELNGLLAQREKIYNQIKASSSNVKIAETNSGGSTGGAMSKKEEVDTSDLETLKKRQQLYKEDVYLYKEYADIITKEELRIALEKARINKSSANEIKNINEQAKIGLEQNAINLGNSLDKIFSAADKQYLEEQKEKNKKEKEEADKVAKLKLEAEKQNQKQLEELQKQHEKFAQVIASNVTNALMSMYDAMQKGESPLQALSDMLGQLIKQFIAAVIQATIFKGLMSLLNVATGGGTGFLGSILGGVGKLLGMAEGGVVSRPTIAMVGEGGQSEAIMPLNKLGNMMNSTFNAGAMSGTGGGGNGQFVLKGNDLVLALQRSNYSLNLRRGA